MEILLKLWLISFITSVELFSVFALISTAYTISDFDSLAEASASELLDTYTRYSDDGTLPGDMLALYEFCIIEPELPVSVALTEPDGSVIASACDYLLLSSYGDGCDDSSSELYLVNLSTLTAKEISTIRYELGSQLVYEINEDAMAAPGDSFAVVVHMSCTHHHGFKWAPLMAWRYRV